MAPGGHVSYRLSSTEGAGWAGLSTCGSVWTCPVDASKVLARRSVELAELLDAANARGCSVGMVTLTMRHREGQSLRALWDAAGEAWSRVTSGKRWVADQARYGVAGWVRAVEATHGENGWHVHVHALVIYHGPTSEALGEQLAEGMWKRWDASLRATCSRCGHRHGPAARSDVRSRHDAGGCSCRSFAGLDSIRDRGGLDYRSSWSAASTWAAEYLTKATADEAVYGALKKGRGGNRTPFELLAAVVELGDADAADAWHEWERVAPGRKMITYSGGLRDWLGLAAEQTDEEIAEEDPGTRDHLALPGPSWHVIRDTDAVWELLRLGEACGIHAVMRWLDEHGISYVIPPTEDG